MKIDMPEVSQHIWETKYRYRDENGPVDRSIVDTWRRVARAAANVEEDSKRWEKVFYDLLVGFRFLPGGRILANAGTQRQATTMFNCYVMGTIEDSIGGIFTVIKEAALTQKQGGGVGFDFSTIRPRGAFISGVDSAASGPLSFMRVLDATCRTIMSAGQRRGAQMGIMRCDHPDIEQFIVAKREDNALRMFNLSVAVTDAFMDAVEKDADWDLVFDGEVHRTVKARTIWDKIMRSTYDFAEPGVFMADHVNQWNNLQYCEDIRATNPCGEQPLPPYGACLLGSLNLTRFVQKPFRKDANIDYEGLAATTAGAVRFLDNIIEISRYPLDKQETEARAKRRMGIGITGLGDMLILLGHRYDSREAQQAAERVMRTIAHAAYGASAELAAEKGAFPAFDATRYLEGKFIQALPTRIRKKIAQHGMRNSHLISIAPTGTISLLAGNLSSGIEPVFAWHYVRKIRRTDENDTQDHEVMDYAYRQYCAQFGRPTTDAELPPAFVTAAEVPAKKHIDMQAVLQKHVDSAISKTINVPEDLPFEEFKDIYRYAYDKGLKGCTTFRPNPMITGVLRRKSDEKKAPETGQGSPPPTRPPVLHGTTYKIKTPVTPNALYVTINDIDENGSRRPYEIFINTKNLQHFGWIVAMTRLISAVFRRESNPSFLVEELMSIYDPSGGYFNAGEFVPSLPAELGRVIRAHLERLGILTTGTGKNGGTPGVKHNTGPTGNSGLMFCPMCRQPALYAEEGGVKCRACGYSKCG